MNNFALGMIYGICASFIIVPLFIWLHHTLKKILEKKKIKSMIKRKEFLMPCDEKDYDVKAWEKEIDVNEVRKNKDKLNNIFIKHEDNQKIES
jgi:hypothetical protein